MSESAADAEALRVVIVDDAAAIRDVLRRLSSVDARIEVVGEAADGREAIEVIDAVDPDVVLLDVRMPVMDGVDTLVHLKGGYEVRIVMYSADSTRKHEALAAGADAWIDKDEGLMAVADALAGLMAHHPIRPDETDEHQGQAPRSGRPHQSG